jgi:hypothetical protein
MYPTIELYLSSEHGAKANEFCDDVTWNLERGIVCPEGYSMYLRVISFICPVSWFAVSVHYSTISINGLNYTIEEGNNTISQLCSTVSRLVHGVTFSFNSITTKVTMSSGIGSVTLGGSMLPLLGILPSSGVTLQSRHTVDLTSNNSIYISCDYNSTTPNVDARLLGSAGLLSRLPVNTGPGGVVVFNNYSGRDGLLVTESILNRVRLRLEDEDRRPLRATLDYDITLQVEYVQSFNTRMRLSTTF